MDAPLHLGSGLYVGRAADEAPHSRARRIGPKRYLAEIAGIKDETIVCEWASEEVFATHADALAAAQAKAGA